MTGLSVGKVVRQSARGTGKDIGRGGRDQHEIAIARKADMPHLGLVRQRENIGMHFILGKRRDRKRRHELRAAGGKDAAHIQPCVAQAADKLQSLVRGNAARNDQEDAPALQGLGQSNHTPLYSEIRRKSKWRQKF